VKMPSSGDFKAFFMIKQVAEILSVLVLGSTSIGEVMNVCNRNTASLKFFLEEWDELLLESVEGVGVMFGTVTDYAETQVVFHATTSPIDSDLISEKTA